MTGFKFHTAWAPIRLPSNGCIESGPARNFHLGLRLVSAGPLPIQHYRFRSIVRMADHPPTIPRIRVSRFQFLIQFGKIDPWIKAAIPIGSIASAGTIARKADRPRRQEIVS